MKRRMEMPGLTVELDGDPALIDVARDLLQGHRGWPPPAPEFVKAKPATPENITRRGLKVNDGDPPSGCGR